MLIIVPNKEYKPLFYFFEDKTQDDALKAIAEDFDKHGFGNSDEVIVMGIFKSDSPIDFVADGMDLLQLDD